MTWRDDLRKVEIDGRQLIAASFRGVPFFVEGYGRSGGRRTAIAEIPFLDEATVDEFGRRARVFRMDGYVLGDDYVSKRDALLTALEETEGPGELVHPYYGSMPAICSGMEVSETRDEGRIARFSIEFTWVPPSLAPLVFVDRGAAADTAAANAQALATAELVANYDAEDLPAFALESAAAGLSAAGESMSAFLGPVVADAQEAALLRVNLMSVTSDAASLVTAPADVAALLVKCLSDLAVTAGDSPGKLAAALISAYAFTNVPFAPDTTPTRQRELANQNALDRVIRRYLAIEAARLTARATYETVEDATRARDAAVALLDEQADVADDSAYGGLVELRAAVVSAVPGLDVLARVITTTLPQATPSIVLSYRLYGTVDGADDIVARNRVRHPAFVPGGVPLQVLSDV